MNAHRELRPLVLISSLSPGGAERVTVSCLCRMARDGRPVPLCSVASAEDSPLAGELERTGVTRHELGATRLADPVAAMNLIRLLRRERYDLVHAHGQDAAILAMATRALHGVPVVITRHVVTEPDDSWRRQMRVRGTAVALRRANAVVAVSHAAAKALRESIAVAGDRVRVIPNGIELERFSMAECDRWRTRAMLGVGPAESLVLVPAVLREGKGHDVVLAALPQIRARSPGVRLVIAGGGPLEPSLRARARELGDAVMFLGHRDDMPALLGAADLVVLASHSEALPTALIEAAAAGRAVVSTRVGGVDEVVADGETGLLVPLGDPEALAEAIVALVTDAPRAHALGVAARQRAQDHFGIDAQVRRTWELWEDVARGVAA